MARGRGAPRGAAGSGVGGRGRGRGRGKLIGGKSPMPFDSQAQRESSELGAEGADTRAALAAGYARAQSQLGFGSGTSPYSDTAENKQNLVNDQRGIANTAGNSLYAGSTLNAQSQARRAYDKAQTRTEEDINQAQGEYTGGVASTARDLALGKAAISEGAINRAAATEPAPLGVRPPGRGRGRPRGPAAAAPPTNRRARGRIR